MGVVYLPHFISKRDKDKRGEHARLKRARHYVGYTDNLARRRAEHRAGRSAVLTRGVAEAGLSLLLVRTWGGATLVDEQRVRNRGGAAKLCSVCSRARRNAPSSVPQRALGG